MIKNEFSDKMQGSADKSCTSDYGRAGLARDLRIYGRFIVGLVLWYYWISHDFVFRFMFYDIMKVFRKFGDRSIVLAKSPFVSSRTSY